MKEAIKAVLNLDYEQAKNDIRYGRNGNGALGEPDTGGEAGRQTGATDARLGERGQTGEGTAERGRGIAGVGGEVRERIDGLSGRIAAAELVKQGHPGREVYLSRYCKIGDIVSEPKVAEEIKNFIGDRDVVIPENVVTPKLRAELEKIGVKIGAPEKGVNKTEQIKEALEDGLTVDNTVLKEEEARLSVRGGERKENSVKEEPQPVGRGAFGDIYDQFKGKAKEAFNFLISRKSGDLTGVFHRNEIGDIDLVWGDKNGGLAHIIEKHINDKDFKTQEEMIGVIDDTINNGEIVKSDQYHHEIVKDGYIVSLRKDYDGVKKNWVVTSFKLQNPNSKQPISDTTL